MNSNLFPRAAGYFKARAQSKTDSALFRSQTSRFPAEINAIDEAWDALEALQDKHYDLEYDATATEKECKEAYKLVRLAETALDAACAKFEARLNPHNISTK